MACLLVSLMFVGWIGAILGLGNALIGILFTAEKESYLKKELRFAVCGFLGAGALSVAAWGYNFFRPVDSVFSVGCLVIGWGLLILERKRVLARFSRDELFTVAALIPYVCLIPYTNLENYDTGLYHWQTVKWMIQSPLPLGLANLHDRFGFNSLWFAFSATVDLPATLFALPNFLSNALAMCFYGSAVMLALRKCYEGDFSLSTLFIAATAIPWLRNTGPAMNSPSPDLPVMLMTFLVIALLISAFEGRRDPSIPLSVATLLATLATTVKLAAAPLLPAAGLSLVAVCLVRRQRVVSARTLAITALLTLCLLTVWVLHGVALSGYLVFPVSETCLKNLQWAVPEDVARGCAEAVKGWARLPTAAYRESLHGGDWLYRWLDTHLPRELTLIWATVSGVVLIALSCIQVRSRRILETQFVVPLITACFGVGFWWLSAPDPRFAYGFLFSVALLVFCQGLRCAGPRAWTEGFPRSQDGSHSPPNMSVMSRMCSANNAREGSQTFFLHPVGQSLSSVMTLVIGCFILVLGLRGQLAVAFCWSGIVLGLALLTARLPRGAWLWIVIAVLLLNGKPFEDALKAGQCWNRVQFPSVQTIERHTAQGLAVRIPVGNDQCWNSDLPCTPELSTKLKAEKSKDGAIKRFWIEKD